MSDKPFRLVEYFPRIVVKPDGESGWIIEPNLTEGQYTQIFSASTSAAWLFETTIDLGGFAREDLTAFFANQSIQRPSPYAVVGVPSPQGGAVFDDVVVITDVPLNTQTWLGTVPFSNVGYPSHASDYMTIQFAHGVRTVQSTTTPQVMIQADGYSFGSAEPTASSKLYCYRWVGISKPAPAAPTDLGVFPELRYVATGLTTDEPEFVYLNRLRRSYELQQL